MSEARNIVILGSGAAGLTAAIYAARANMKPLVVDGPQQGGQLTITSDVENFPGFKDPILGPDLMTAMREQAARLGVDFLAGEASGVDLSARPFRLKVEGTEVLARTLVIATGASARWLGLDSEQALFGKGVSACATCDGFFFRNLKVVVVGGGDTAMEEATFLTRFASEVVVVHRKDTLRASSIMQERAHKNPKIRFVWDSAITGVMEPSQGKVTGVKVKNLKTGEDSEIACDGLFIAIGHQPNTAALKGQLPMDANGYLKLEHGTRTAVPGVFAAGDVADHEYRQAVTAAGTGCMAALDAQRFLEAQGES